MPLISRAKNQPLQDTKPWWSKYPRRSAANYREGDLWCTFWTHQYYIRARSPHWVWLEKEAAFDILGERREAKWGPF